MCTSIKQWSSDGNEDGGDNNNQNVDDKLIMNRFALFRLCPSDNYSSCDQNYGEYLINLEDYLMSTTEYFQAEQEDMCDMCDENCQQDDGGDGDGDDGNADDANQAAANTDCDTCVDECDKIENMEDNGYLEASNYIECQQLEQENDADDDYQPLYYAGASCSSDGSKIKIGVYNDEDCAYIDSNLYVDDFLNGFKLSHALLKNVYSGTEIACMSYDEDGEAEENEACANLYEAAAACETDNGFAGNANADGNQAANEDSVCDFIDQIKGGSYSPASGEIVLTGKNSVNGGGQSTTGGQKFALTVLVLGTLGLAVYAASIHSHLTKGAKSDLSNQGGQMA